MIYCGLYFLTRAYQKSKTKDLIKYFADPQNQELGIIKQQSSENKMLN